MTRQRLWPTVQAPYRRTMKSKRNLRWTVTSRLRSCTRSRLGLVRVRYLTATSVLFHFANRTVPNPPVPRCPSSSSSLSQSISRHSVRVRRSACRRSCRSHPPRGLNYVWRQIGHAEIGTPTSYFENGTGADRHELSLHGAHNLFRYIKIWFWLLCLTVV